MKNKVQQDVTKKSKRPSRAQKLAINGVSDFAEFKRLMEAVMCDVLTEDLKPELANASCNAAGKLLAATALQLKLSQPTANASRHFQLMA